jgi:metal-responsive CopG/Arc/MetJ family transcriptional regulator
MKRQAVTVRLPTDLLEQVKRFQENRESFNELVVEAVTREVQRRQALAAHQRIVARSAEVERQTGVQPSSIELIRQLRDGEGRRG